MPDVRQARVRDHRVIVECVQKWWGDSRTPDQARALSLLLPKLFLQFFSSTSLVMEDGTGINAFLVGFYSADNEDEAYIHFVGVDPTLRGQGVARMLYAAFLQRAAEAGRQEVRAITSPANAGSIAFHRAMGFELEKGDHEVNGLPVHSDYDGRDRTGCAFTRGSGRPRSEAAPESSRRGEFIAAIDAPRPLFPPRKWRENTPNYCSWQPR